VAGAAGAGAVAVVPGGGDVAGAGGGVSGSIWVDLAAALRARRLEGRAVWGRGAPGVAGAAARAGAKPAATESGSLESPMC
jgi:hypothetical protein